MVRASGVLLAAVMLGALVASAGTVADLDRKNGFRDARFGMNPEQIGNMVQVDTDGDLKYYTRTTDSKKIGGAQTDRITYGFYKNRLWAVMIEAKGLGNSSALRGALDAAYGAGRQDNQYIEKYFWGGSNVRMVFTQNRFSNDSKAFLFSVPLQAMIDEDEASVAANAAEDL